MRSSLPFLDTDKPIMFTTDLYDYVPSSMYEGYLLRPNARLSTGNGHNAPRPPAGSPLIELVGDPIDRFVRHFVLGEDNGADADPRVRLMTNLGSVRDYKAGKVLVRWEDDWPLPSTQWTRLFLNGTASGSARSLNDGSLSLSAPAGGQSVAPLVSVSGPKSELRALLTAANIVNGQLGPAIGDGTAFSFGDLRDEEARSLTYTTPALAENVEVTGPITLRLFAQSTTPNLEWAVRLTDVWPDGSSQWISDGQLRASLRRVDDARSWRNTAGDIIRPWHTFAQHEPVDGVVEYLIEITPTSNVFRAGHRIRLDVVPVAATSFDGARTGGAGAVVVHHSAERPSSVLLPVIGSRCHLGQPGVAGTDVPDGCAASLTEAWSG